MATLKFYIKDTKSDKTSIYFLLNYGSFEVINGKKKYTPLKYYINESINPDYWNNKTGRAKQDKRFRQFPEFNARLQDIEDRSLSLLRKMQNDGEEITNDLLRSKLDEVFKSYKNQSSKNDIDAIDFIDYYIEVSGMKPNTKKSYKQTARDLREYEADKSYKITFDRIDIDFHDKFILWLKNKGYSINTIGDRIKVLKSIMRSSHERGLHNNTDYQKKAFKRPQEETTSIYLTDNELVNIYNLNLSVNERLNQVRDWFIIASYTGLRFSDFSRLTKENINNDNITVKTQKTGAKVVIPIHTFVKSILEKYNYNLPKVISNQKFNEYIKDVCDLAKIHESVLIEETKGNLKASKEVKKCKLVTAHTARRSFATNAYLSGVPTISIMKITGHKTEKVFMKYIKVTESENAKKLQLHPFFNKMIVK